MATEILDFTPIRDGYSAEMGYDTIETSLSSKYLRKRHNFVMTPHVVNLQWVLDRVQYTAFMGFFRTTLEQGTLAFRMPLITNIATTTLHRCRSLQGMPKLTQVKSMCYYVSCTLEVEPNPTFTAKLRFEDFTISYPQAYYPFFNYGFRTGDTVVIYDSDGIHPSGTALNFNGTYIVTGIPDLFSITVSPGLGPWATLAGLSPSAYGDAGNGDVTSTITRFPTS